MPGTNYYAAVPRHLSELVHERGTGGVGIGNPDEMTVLEFARKIIRATGSRSKIAFKPLPQDDPKQRRPDISRARKMLGWKPKVPLEEGLKHTIEYFRGKV